MAMPTPVSTLYARELSSIAVAVGDTHHPGISWSAVFAGATDAAAVSLILLVLGVGLGLSAVSPWTAMRPGFGAVGMTALA